MSEFNTKNLSLEQRKQNADALIKENPARVPIII